jgi:hypothetical protein
MAGAALRAAVRRVHFQGMEPTDEATRHAFADAIRREEALLERWALVVSQPERRRRRLPAAQENAAVARGSEGNSGEANDSDSDDEGGAAEGSFAWVDAEGRTFDVRRALLYWLGRPANHDLGEAELRLKVVSLHAMDRACRKSTLGGTLRSELRFRDGGSMECGVWSPKGHAGKLIRERLGVDAFPACDHVCTVAATRAYLELTKERAQHIAAEEHARTGSMAEGDLRNLDRARQGKGVPFLIALAGARAQTPLLTATVGKLMATALETIGIPNATAHMWRHGAASGMLRAGVAEEDVKAIGMWSANSTVMQQYYATAVARVDEAAWQRAAEAWWNASRSRERVQAIRTAVERRRTMGTHVPAAWALRQQLLEALERIIEQEAVAAQEDGEAKEEREN